MESAKTEHESQWYCPDYRRKWIKMGIIVKVEPDPKGCVRSAVFKTKTSELRRPVHKLVLLLAPEDQLDVPNISKDADKPWT